MTFDEFWKHYVGGDKDKSLETGRIYAASAWDYQQARIEALEAMWSVVFDGNEVLRYLNYEAKQRLAGKDVSDVLDAVNRAGKLRARKPAALLESEPAAHTCNPSCQLPACVLRRRVEELEAQRRWIPVNERLPERNEIVIVEMLMRNGERRYDQMIGELIQYNDHVIRWMCAPQEPTP